MSRKQANITEERILQLVRERPFVFDPKERLYKHRLTHVNGWPYIARDVNLSVERCVRIWERIRKQYTEYLGKQRKNPSKDKLAFRYSQAMEFYRDFYRPYKSKISRVYKEDASSGEEDSVRSPLNQDHVTNQTISNHMIPHNSQVLRNPPNNDSQSINFNEFFVSSDPETHNRASVQTRSTTTRQADHPYHHHHNHHSPAIQSSSQPTQYHHHYPPPPSTPQIQENPKDEFQLFGDMVALKLRKMQERSPEESVNAQIQILTILK